MLTFWQVEAVDLEQGAPSGIPIGPHPVSIITLMEPPIIGLMEPLMGAPEGCSTLKLRYDFTTFPLGVSLARVSATGFASSGKGFGAR